MLSLKEGVFVVAPPDCGTTKGDGSVYLPSGSSVDVSFDKLRAPLAKNSVDVSTSGTKQVLTSQGCSDAFVYSRGSAFPMHFRTAAKGSRYILYMQDPALDKEHYIIDPTGHQYTLGTNGDVTAQDHLIEAGSSMPVAFSDKAKAMVYGQ